MGAGVLMGQHVQADLEWNRPPLHESEHADAHVNVLDELVAFRRGAAEQMKKLADLHQSGQLTHAEVSDDRAAIVDRL
jgi:hypothetical protein